jgi:hypothetical protein
MTDERYSTRNVPVQNRGDCVAPRALCVGIVLERKRIAVQNREVALCAGRWALGLMLSVWISEVFDEVTSGRVFSYGGVFREHSGA